jgi:hypothetical protein
VEDHVKNVVAYLIAAVVFATIGVVTLTASRFERQLADAQERTSTQQYARAQQSLDAADVYLRYARWLPKIGPDTVREVRARQAALQYWQGGYDKVLPAQAEPVAAVDESNDELQLVVANAAYRVGLKGVKDRTAAVQALNEAANGYLTVLKNNHWHEEAAYNYEYVIRLRDEIAKGRRAAAEQPQQGMDLGQSGAPSDATSTKGFQIYVPLQGDEKSPEGGDAGKATEKVRKG